MAFAILEGDGVPTAVGFGVSIGITAGGREAEAAVVGLGDRFAFAGLERDGIIVAPGTGFPHRRDGIGLAGGEQRERRVALIAQLDVGQGLVGQLDHLAFLDIIDRLVVLLQVLFQVILLDGILHRLVPAPDLHVRAVGVEDGGVFLLRLGRGAEEEACRRVREAERAVLVDHPAGGQGLVAPAGDGLGRLAPLGEPQLEGLISGILLCAIEECQLIALFVQSDLAEQAVARLHQAGRPFRGVEQVDARLEVRAVAFRYEIERGALLGEGIVAHPGEAIIPLAVEAPHDER